VGHEPLLIDAGVVGKVRVDVSREGVAQAVDRVEPLAMTGAVPLDSGFREAG